MSHLISEAKFEIPTPLPSATFWQVPKEQKSHAEAKTRHYPILLRINFASTLSNIEVVKLCVSSKYIVD